MADEHRKQAADLVEEGKQAAQSGDAEGALDLYRQALEVCQKQGDAGGEAEILHHLARLALAGDDGERAMELYRRALDLKDRIGDLAGQANTLANMAFVAFRSKDTEGAARFNLNAITCLERIGAWSEMVTVVNNHAFLDQAAVRAARAQALWLALRTPVTPEGWLNRCAELVNEMGPEAPVSLLVAAAAPLVLVRNSGEDGVDRQHRTKALLLVAACADVRDVPPEDLNDWMVREKLLEGDHLLPRLATALEELVGPGGWLFNATLAPSPWWHGEPN
ncbi:MAG: tetratricopeptide repeat protein [Magnetococcales bacterium]|nr:tetratricopeptide repeat protein [Magnetococcales bacterium]